MTHEELAVMMSEIKADIEKLTNEVAKTREIVETWQAVKTGGKAVAWLAKLFAGIIALWIVFKSGAGLIVDIGGGK